MLPAAAKLSASRGDDIERSSPTAKRLCESPRSRWLAGAPDS
jgi:hypothetical protein